MDSPAPENRVSLRKRRRARRRAVMKKLMADYTLNTTLHGLKYTTESGIHIIERIFWIITFTLSFGICLWLIRNVWLKWQASPVIVSFSEKLIPVEMIPFPSLTVCPQIKARATVYNYTEKFRSYFSEGGLFETMEDADSSDNATSKKIDPDDLKTFLDITLVCPLPFYMPTADFNVILDTKVTNASTVDKILEVSPGLDYFEKCYWLGRDIKCSDIFSTVLTDEGVCLNFNGLAANEIFRTENIQKDYKYSEVTKQRSGYDLNIGYNNSDDVDYWTQYPYRGQYSRHRPYLEVIFLTPKDDYDGNCNVINKGYKVYTQDPASQPQASVYSYAILPGQLSALALKVNMMNTSEKLAQYDSEVRQCFFSSEKYLRYFKLYTASNCLLECMSNYTFQMCQCVSFHMPHVDSRSICTLQRTDCLAQARGANRTLLEYIDECDCLPNCNSITYEAEILKTEYHLEKSIKNIFTMNGNDDVGDMFSEFEYSKLDVYYRDSGFITITRSELFGITDFLANIGGLLSLFLGFSFLSLVEVFYFLTIRLGFKFYKDIKNEKANDKKPKLQSTAVEEAEANRASKVKHF